MPDSSQTSKALLDALPSAVAVQRGQHQGGRGLIEYQTLRNAVLQTARAKSRVVSGYGALATGSGVAATAALYTVDIPAGEVLVDGTHDRAAAAADSVLIGAGQTVTSYALDGSAAAVIPDDDDSVRFALVAILVNGAVELRAVFGDVAADGAETAPTAAEIGTALQAAEIANADLTVGVILGRGKVARAGGGVTITGVDPDSDDSLRAEQLLGSLFNLPSA